MFAPASVAWIDLATDFGLLPDTDEVVSFTRVWLASCAYVVTDAAVAGWVAEAHAIEQTVVRSALTQRWSPDWGPSPLVRDDVVATVHTAVTGLRVDRCHVGASFEEVRRSLDATLGLVGQRYPPAVA